MIRVLRNMWVTALLVIAVVEVFMQVDTSLAQNSATRGPVLRSAIGYPRYRRRHISNPPCVNGISDDADGFSDTNTKIRETEFVFTGKVTAQIPSAENRDPLKRNEEMEDGAAKFSVRVKRVLKGELPFHVESGDDLRNTKQMTVKIRTMDKPKGLRNCSKRPIRVHHTAIFLAKRVKDISGDFMLQLTSDPLPLTLRNLDKVNAAVKDMTYKPRPPIIEEPCEKTYCAYGANCVQTPDGRAECQCPTECPAMFTPVCGTDGVTYTNRCMMRMKSCRQEKNTRVQHEGVCEMIDPCRDKKCPYGARCVASIDGRTGTCECPTRCPAYGDHAGSRPVCGSDGIDYRDQCEMRRAACAANREVTVRFHGKCDPCENVNCPQPEVCQLDEQRNPVCRCGDTCSLEFTPVCGSDGKTYQNECSLRQEACRSRKNLRIIYRGKCSSGVNPCVSVRCQTGEECDINKFGIARCECPPQCEPVLRPVCGQDGRTYESLCEMRRAACMQKTLIEVKYTGSCGGMGPCSSHLCDYGAHCVERGGRAVCECPVCPAEFDPVCGSDGISYGNECKLRLEACEHRRDIAILYRGLCNGCENKKCDHYSICESDGTGVAKCVCPESCVEVRSPVCGTDGVTYKNECEMRIAACRSKQFVMVAYKGDCDLCQGVECQWGARCEAGECVCPTNCGGSAGIHMSEPVCASNMVTYPNECELHRASCNQPPGNPPLTVIFYGDCREKNAVPPSTLHVPSSHHWLIMKYVEDFVKIQSCSDRCRGSDPLKWLGRHERNIRKEHFV